MSGGSKKPKASVVGYRYYRTLHMGICHGPIDTLRSIWIKDKVAWTGALTRQTNGASRIGYVDNPGLFGGDDLEGGAQGWFEVNFGALDQVLLGVNADGTSNVNSISQLGLIVNPVMPAKATNFRGMAVLNFLDFYWGSNPYLSDIAFEIDSYWQNWYGTKAIIGVDANPANIIYQAITNDQWGMGYTIDQIDDLSFRKTADTLFNEGLGLSQAWSEQEPIEDFIDGICEQIDGVFFYNQRTGKWTLNLVRAGDPVVMRLDVDNCKLTSFSRRALGETVNELTVRYVSPETEEYVAVTVQDIANIQATGQVIPGSKDYPGVRRETLAGKLGLRDLREISATLASAEVTANRQAWNLNPGEVVEFVWPIGNAIATIYMRTTQVTHSQKNPDIRVSLIEDVFSQDETSFTGDSETGWVDDRQQPTQFDLVVPFEMPYWYVFQAGSGVVPDDLVTYGAVLPVSPNGATKSVTLHALRTLASTAVFEEVDRANVTPSGLLMADLTRSVTTSTITLLQSSITALRLIEIDSFAVIGDGEGAEMVRVVGRMVDGVATIQRGLMDTHPKEWPIGTRIYFIGENQFPADSTPRSMAEVVNYKVTMQTSLGTTTIADVPTTTEILIGRQGRPYSVANVRIATEYWPATVSNESGFMRVTWNTRNRILQNSQAQVLWNQPSVTPEDGQQTLVFLSKDGTVVSSALITNGNTFLDLPVNNAMSGTVTLSIRTIRADLDNYQDFEHTFSLNVAVASGWGADWGADYGD